MLKDRGIIIRFEKEGLDTSRVTSEIFFTWTSAFAQGESESLSNNVKWGSEKGTAKEGLPFHIRVCWDIGRARMVNRKSYPKKRNISK